MTLGVVDELCYYTCNVCVCINYMADKFLKNKHVTFFQKEKVLKLFHIAQNTERQRKKGILARQEEWAGRSWNHIQPGNNEAPKEEWVLPETVLRQRERRILGCLLLLTLRFSAQGPLMGSPGQEPGNYSLLGSVLHYRQNSRKGKERESEARKAQAWQCAKTQNIIK